MRTDHLVAALAADSLPPAMAPRRALMIAFAAGGAAALALFFWRLGMRPDFWVALWSWRFSTKVLMMAAAVVAGLLVIVPTMRPVSHGLRLGALVLLAAAQAFLVVLELVMSPSEAWLSQLMGRNNMTCLVSVTILSAAPLAALILAMRPAAPASAMQAGAAAGFLAASLASLLYAVHCPDDSPLFVAVWYPIAMTIVVSAGALIGSRALRW